LDEKRLLARGERLLVEGDPPSKSRQPPTLHEEPLHEGGQLVDVKRRVRHVDGDVGNVDGGPLLTKGERLLKLGS
jgi:hypothetical protein